MLGLKLNHVSKRGHRQQVITWTYVDLPLAMLCGFHRRAISLRGSVACIGEQFRWESSSYCSQKILWKLYFASSPWDQWVNNIYTANLFLINFTHLACELAVSEGALQWMGDYCFCRRDVISWLIWHIVLIGYWLNDTRWYSKFLTLNVPQTSCDLWGYLQGCYWFVTT